MIDHQPVRSPQNLSELIEQRALDAGRPLDGSATAIDVSRSQRTIDGSVLIVDDDSTCAICWSGSSAWLATSRRQCGGGSGRPLARGPHQGAPPDAAMIVATGDATVPPTGGSPWAFQ